MILLLMNFAALESRVPPWAPVATPLLLFETRSKQNADRKRIEREGMPVGFLHLPSLWWREENWRRIVFQSRIE